jgi:hypothetical protein
VATDAFNNEYVDKEYCPRCGRWVDPATANGEGLVCCRACGKTCKVDELIDTDDDYEWCV